MKSKKQNGGKRAGAGRKPKADEDKAKNLIKQALKKLYKKDSDDENTILFLHSFAQTSKGQQFIAEHLLGKPKDVVESSVKIQSIEPIEWVE
jgi:hypothetical protein